MMIGGNVSQKQQVGGVGGVECGVECGVGVVMLWCCWCWWCW